MRFIPARAGNTPARLPVRVRFPVHPRAGGEHESTARIWDDRAGSSPRGRGTRERRPVHLPDRRFIPARAGNTSTSPISTRARTVHPRAGGEHEPLANVRQFRFGSSPRGRGTRRHGASTRAWKTVHPRAGGEHYRTPGEAKGSIGSSPRGRGTRCRPRSTAPVATVHPRAGGEHSIENRCSRGATGSSPRGRGTHDLGRHVARCRRFIPARAGNTLSQDREGTPRSVHPRAGGEHTPKGRAGQFYAGSSPRGRGTRVQPRRRHSPRRFIPARAGNTPTGHRRCRRKSVHPRAGGEHLCEEMNIGLLIGSSPRGRGTLFSQPTDSAGLFRCQRTYHFGRRRISRSI